MRTCSAVLQSAVHRVCTVSQQHSKHKEVNVKNYRGQHYSKERLHLHSQERLADDIYKLYSTYQIHTQHATIRSTVIPNQASRHRELHLLLNLQQQCGIIPECTAALPQCTAVDYGL